MAEEEKEYVLKLNATERKYLWGVLRGRVDAVRAAEKGFGLKPGAGDPIAEPLMRRLEAQDE